MDDEVLMPAPWSPAPMDLALAPNEVHLFLTSTAVPGTTATVAFWESFLSPDEQQKISRIRIPAKRAQSLIARAMLRQQLSQILNTDPKSLCLTTNAHGKPHLLPQTAAAGPPLNFNLSHTDGWVLLAVCQDREVGVDVETVRENIECEELARRYFAPREYAGIMALAPDDRTRAFFQVWTRKEALLKATGRGIAWGLDKFEVPLGEWVGPKQLGEWSLYDVPLIAMAAEKPCLAALAVKSAGARLHRWSASLPTPSGP